MDIYNEKQFNLSKTHPSKQFTLKYSFTTVRIERIILTSLLGQKNEDWTKVINNIIIDFKSIETETGREYSFVLPLIGKLSPSHRNPVFNVEIEIPQENIGKFKSLTPFFDKVIISLKDPDKLDSTFNMTFTYQDKPGLDE